jgi:hypothetical protein
MDGLMDKKAAAIIESATSLLFIILYLVQWLFEQDLEIGDI